MTVYEIPNIEYCTVTSMANGVYFKIVTNEGWYLHLHNGVEDTVNDWKTVALLPATYDFSQVEIRAEADLPEDAIICGGNDNDHEVM